MRIYCLHLNYLYSFKMHKDSFFDAIFISKHIKKRKMIFFIDLFIIDVFVLQCYDVISKGAFSLEFVLHKLVANALTSNSCSLHNFFKFNVE